MAIATEASSETATLMRALRNARTIDRKGRDLNFIKARIAERVEGVLYLSALRIIAEGRADPDPASFALRILQDSCGRCDGEPPRGFTCNRCGNSR